MTVPTPPEITEITFELPAVGQDDDQFDTNQANFVNYQQDFGPEVNDLALWMEDTANSTEGWANDAEASATDAEEALLSTLALAGGSANKQNLGSHASAPTTRNDGSALQNNDLYYNYTNETQYRWSSVSSTWSVYVMPGINIPKFQIITSNTTWTKPAKFVEGSLYVTGIGGGASGCSSDGLARAGANSGEAVYRARVDVSAVSSVPVAIGAGGASVNGGGVNTAGNAGGATTFGALLSLAGAAATPLNGRAATVGGAFGAVNNTSVLSYLAQRLGLAIAGNEGGSSGTTSTAQANGAGGIVVDGTGTKAGDIAGAGSPGGGIGYGAGGASIINVVASGAGAPGVLVLEWEETR